VMEALQTYFDNIALSFHNGNAPDEITIA